VRLPLPTLPRDKTPAVGTTTPETYLGLGKKVNFGGDEEYASGSNSYTFPAELAGDSFALDGDWAIDFQNATPAEGDASIRLNYTGSEVRMVLGGSGTVTLTADGQEYLVTVSGVPNSYRLLKTMEVETGTLEVTVSPGVEVYSFTFG